MMDDTELILDDDLDAVNDETFGDDGEDCKWDGNGDPVGFFSLDQENEKGEHAILEEVGQSHRKPLGSVQESQFYDCDDQEGTYMNVEESISRLVLDDDDCENDQHRFLVASHKSLMPPQVINRNLTWMTEKELGNPLFSSSVWSMHPTDVLESKIQGANAVKTSSASAAVQQQSPTRAPPGLTPKSTGFRTLEEIEQELLSSSEKSAVSNDVHPLSAGRARIRQPENQSPRGNAPQYNQVPFMGPPPYGNVRPGLLHHPHGAQRFPYGQRPQIPGAFRGPFPAGMPVVHQLPSLPRLNLNFMRHQGPNGCPPPQFARPPGMQRNIQNYNIRTFDFSGIMNEKDKQRLRNIQMLQLQNDHPYTTDFYYQMKQYSKDDNKIHLRKVFPLTANLPHRNAYEPTRFEHALGKLQAVSALAPKKVIDTFIRVQCTGTEIGSRQAKILMGIEWVYRMYLDLKEYHLRKEAETLDEGYQFQKEFQLYSKILDALDAQGANLAGWTTYRKGRGLLLKLALEFYHFERGVTAAFMILTNMIKYSSLVDMLRVEPKEVLSINTILKDIIRNADVIQTDLLLQGLQPHMWRSFLGCTIFFLVLQRAAELVINGGVMLDWSRFHYLQSVTDIPPRINSHPDDEMTGFLRLPSAINSFIAEESDDFGETFLIDVSGNSILNMIEMIPNEEFKKEVWYKAKKVLQELEIRNTRKGQANI